MVGLADFPVELIRAVCSQLCIENYNGGHPDISRLSRTCRRLRDVIQPLVFTAFAPIGHVPLCPQILQLTHTLSLRPDLAHCLEYIDLAGVFSEDPLSKNDIDLLNSIITKLDFRPLAWGAFSNPNPLPVIELLLLHCPNLVRLELALSEEWRPLFLPAIYRRQASANNNNNTGTPTSILPRLVTLTLAHHCITRYRWELGLPSFLTILRAAAPNLGYLSTDNPGGEIQAATTMLGHSLYPPLANLVHLEFDRVCSLQPDVLRGIVAAAPSLQVFALSAGDSWDDLDECTVVDVWEAVWLRRGTLREVRLDIVYNKSPGENRGARLELELGGLGWSGSLEEFRRLEILKVGHYALRVLEEACRRSENGVDGGVHGDGFVENLLPSSIREVTFWEPEGRWAVALQLLAEAVAWNPERYPDLLSVVVAPVPDNEQPREWKDKDEWLRSSAELEKQFQRAGVRFEAQGVRGQEPAGPFEMQNPFQF
ncbi:hypothetical protein OQA88_3439 [Cercophora sp. LCS_1]